ncbi:hypothetical protein [Actinomadura madurae]|uniref:hypothetical protein n=1 Tax=Actinomadura madurae TaxID=1993 RepID=UPI0020D2572A|nr:hypothetical protein [Actinomadura madurae]MCQ0016708.1 hypothetical protein [Actinomadura madurae]
MDVARLLRGRRLRRDLLGVQPRRAALPQPRRAPPAEHGDLRLDGAAYHGRAVYLSGTAAELTGRDLDRGIEIYPGDPGRGGTALSIEDVTAPAAWRLYRATISEAFVLCPREPRRRAPCTASPPTIAHP